MCEHENHKGQEREVEVTAPHMTLGTGLFLTWASWFSKVIYLVNTMASQMLSNSRPPALS